MNNDDFKLDDLNHPLYEYSQVMTQPELENAYMILMDAYKKSRWWQVHAKYDLAVMMSTIGEMILWIRNGKPQPQNERRKM